MPDRPETSVADELSWAQRTLADAGIESSRADAEWLLAATLDVDRGRLLVLDGIDAAAAADFRVAVRRRASRVPLQHIIGTAAFGPAELAVGPGVFTPRPETEFLAEWATRHLSAEPAPSTVVDLCSGSGALAVAIALLVPTARVYAVERSAEALIWLRRNVNACPSAVSDRITVVSGDVTDAAAMRAALPAGTVDVVVANPPYVPLNTDVSAEVAHDPADAVYGGADGMSVIIPMLPVIAELLRPGGVTGIEHDETTSVAVLAAVRATDAFDDVAPRDDLTGRPRFVTARRVVTTR